MMRVLLRVIQIKLGELNEDFISSINTSSSVGKVAFRLIRNAKSADFLEWNSKIDLDRLVSKYAPHTALFLLMLKSEFCISKLEKIKNDSDELISNLKSFKYA